MGGLAPGLGEKKGALIGDDVGKVGGFVAEPNWRSEHADADGDEGEAEEREEFEGARCRAARCDEAGAEDPKNGEGGPKNSEDHDEPAHADEAGGDGLAGPGDAFA